MSVAGLGPGQDRLFKKTIRRSTDSDELDVFEASRYFSGEPSAPANGGDYWSRASSGGSGGRRISLDMPGMRNHRQSLFSSSNHAAAEPKQTHKEKKHKQPSSPGGRIASFLNSLFTHSAGKKKKTGGAATSAVADDGRRKRRSSISHFPTNPDQNDAVFAVPAPATLAVTPTKIAFRSLSDHTQTVSPSTTKNPDEKLKLKLRPTNEEPINLTTNTNTNNNNNNKNRGSDRNRPVFDFNDLDDGEESDSSSNLFELRNYDLIDYSNELPVYETTHMESVGAPISVHGR